MEGRALAEMTPQEAWAEVGRGLAGLALGDAGRLSPVFILSMIAIAFALWLLRRPGAGFWAWAFPKSVYFHPSHWVDIKVFVLGRLLSALGVVSRIGLAAWVTASISTALSGGVPPTGFWSPWTVAALVLVVTDFCVYWVHRIHHETRLLWPFHALHHSAEVLTPVTVFRKHPIYDLISAAVRGVVLGAVLGVILGLFVGEVTTAQIASIQAFYFLFHIAGSNLRHSHIWLSYGPVLERILISPAQHQIHHSRAPRHHNRNYGEVLAIWDWMFGTLYVPSRQEILEFGLAGPDGTPQPQPHPTLRAAMVVPFRDSWREARRAFGRRHQADPRPARTPEDPSRAAE